MSKNVIIILIGAICTALVVAFSVQAMLAPEPEPAGPAMNVSQVLVAAEKISAGEEMASTKVKWQDWPADAIISGAYVKTEDTKLGELKMMGKPARRDIEVGEPILPSAIILDAEGNFLAATIEEGMLGYSIPVSPSSSVGGFARPGDRVDVILTYAVRVNNDQSEAQQLVRNHASETILEDVRVLAVDQIAREEEREAKIGKVVTLEVSPKGAEVLALALEMGEISLALRRLGSQGEPRDTAAVGPTTDVAISKTLQNLNNLNNGGAAAGRGDGTYANGRSTATIRVYRGSETERITVPLGR